MLLGQKIKSDWRQLKTDLLGCHALDVNKIVQGKFVLEKMVAMVTVRSLRTAQMEKVVISLNVFLK